MKVTKLLIERFGEINEETVNSMRKIFKESYEQLGSLSPESLDLYLFENSRLMRSSLEDEQRKLGIRTSSLGEKFIATHDAWQDKPRIMLSLDKFSEYPQEVILGAIRHEIGHSILHGALKYYSIKIGEDSLGMRRYNLSLDYVNALLYLISIAVKDYEVTNLLYRRGFVEDQVAYAEHTLEPSMEDALSWKLAEGNSLGRILCSTAALKEIGCSIPLADDERYGDEVKEHISRRISYFSPHYRVRIEEIAYEGFASLGDDTMDNIETIANTVAETIIDPELRDGHNKGFARSSSR